MGAYLSEPVVEKQTESAKGDRGIHYGATSMQGWRINQEDAHNCILNFTDDCSFFAVYDGHGGPEVAQYAAMKLPDFLKTMPTWNDGRVGQALEDAFLTFDELLTREDVMDELKILSGKKENETDDTEEDKALLYEEACLPLDDVLRRYGITIDGSIRIAAKGERRIMTPKLKIKRREHASTDPSTGEDGNNIPTPPTSPDSKSAAAAAAAAVDHSEPTNTADKCDTCLDEPQEVGVNSSQETRPKLSLKRKSIGSKLDPTEEHNSAELSSNEATPMDDGDKKKAIQANGLDETGYKADTAVSNGSPLKEVPVKRFKNETASSAGDCDEMAADSTTTCVEDSKDGETPGNQALNGNSHTKCKADSAAADSTSPDGKIATSENVSSSNVTAKNAGSPMIVEDSISSPQTDQNRLKGARKPVGSNKGCAMDESSGTNSEDDEDEDYNMEVEDEETSEESSESESIEEDEIVDPQDEMGVDEEAEDEEEEEEDDDEMFAVPSGDTPGVDSGTTACVVVIRGSTIHVANAGDTRCVLCRGDKAVDLSMDHKPEDPAEKRRIELAGGKITADGRVNGGLNLSRAIGDHFYKRNSELPLRDQMITALPDVRVESVRPEDQFFVLACDGIWNSMSSQDVVDFVRIRLEKRLEPATICEQLCDVCLAPNTIGDGTGCDNMTAIIVLLNQTALPDGGNTVEANRSIDTAETGAQSSETKCIQGQE